MTHPDRAPLANAQPDFVISRLFDAPRELVWQAWTQTEHLNRWFGPKGCTIPACSMDLRPGGIFHYGMRTPDGREMWGKWTFLEIASPGRLVLISSFSDAKGGVTRHPLSATWPLQTMSTMSLIEENGQTRMTLCWSPHQPTEVERRTFDSAHEGMKQGWSGTLDQLDSYLAAARPQIGRLDEPRVLDLPTRLLARISLTVPRSEIQEVMGSGLQELMGSLAKQGITPAGPWFTHHCAWTRRSSISRFVFRCPQRWPPPVASVPAPGLRCMPYRRVTTAPMRASERHGVGSITGLRPKGSNRRQTFGNAMLPGRRAIRTPHRGARK